MPILPNNHRKINPDGLFYTLTGLIIVGCTLGGYALGRATRVPEHGRVLGSQDSARVLIDTSLSDEFLRNAEDREALPKSIMASKNGTRYYPVGCTAGGSIAEENQVWFATENEAKMAGYSLAKACQPK